MATSGRDFLIIKGGTAIAGLRTKSLAFDGSNVDKTNADDEGFITFGDFSGAKSWTITANGVLESNDAFIDIALNPDASLLLTDVTLRFADGSTIAGNVRLSSATYAGDHDGENTYDVTLNSSGKWTYTAA